MSQINIHVSPEFEANLKSYMQKKGITHKSEAIRQAMSEAVSRLKTEKRKTDFRQWRGMALKAPLNKKPRFKSDDELWD